MPDEHSGEVVKLVVVRSNSSACVTAGPSVPSRSFNSFVCAMTLLLIFYRPVSTRPSCSASWPFCCARSRRNATR